VREYVLRARPKAPVISLPTPDSDPGQMAENDWSPYEIDFAVGRRTIQVGRGLGCLGTATASEVRSAGASRGSAALRSAAKT